MRWLDGITDSMDSYKRESDLVGGGHHTVGSCFPSWILTLLAAASHSCQRVPLPSCWALLSCTEGSGAGGVQTAKASRKQSSLSGKESAQGCLPKRLLGKSCQRKVIPNVQKSKDEDGTRFIVTMRVRGQ